MKKKHKKQRGLCLCEYTPALSDEAAVQIFEFLQVMSASLLTRYGSCIERHNTQKTKLNVKALDPWNDSDEPF
jgi:hypothetical protein